MLLIFLEHIAQECPKLIIIFGYCPHVRRTSTFSSLAYENDCRCVHFAMCVQDGGTLG